jgi:hypothetical protein
MNRQQPPDFDSVADANARRAFLGAPAAEWLQPGTRLYKWTKSIFGARGVTPWWFFLESRVLTNGVRCPGLRERQKYANRLNVSDRDYHRVRGAVTKQFNTMATPICISLTTGAWGYSGKAAGQIEDQDIPRVFLIGGDYQLWIPNLEIADFILISISPYVTSK